jgi:hypothetical protein
MDSPCYSTLNFYTSFNLAIFQKSDTNSRLSPLPPEPAGFNYGHDATIDIPIDTSSGGRNFKVDEYMNQCFSFFFFFSW